MTSIFRFRRWVAGTAAAALAALIFAWSASGQTAADIVEEFKYGSVGTEETVGVPYWVWRVLPEVFPDKLPNRPGTGYARLGFLYESPSRDLPIGASRSGGLIPRVGLNCATCHVGTYRADPGTAPAIVIQPCPRCQAMRRPHHVCGECGYYDGKQRVAAREA